MANELYGFDPLELERTLHETLTGQYDTRSDDEVAWSVAEDAIKRGEQPPEYAREGWQRYRTSQKDGIFSSVGKGFASEWEGTKAALKGGVALGLRGLGAADEDSFLSRPYQGLLTSAMSNLDKAGEDGPFIQSFGDVRTPGDLLDLAGAFAGGALQSVVEAGVSAGVGALVGSATAPGAGTVGGGVTGLFGKKAAKKYVLDEINDKVKDAALRDSLTDYAEKTFAKDSLATAHKNISKKLVESGVGFTEDVLEKGLRTASTKQAMASMGKVALIGESFVQNSGEVFTDLVSRGQDTDKAAWTSVTTGTVNAFLDTWFESRVLDKVFGQGADEVRKVAKGKVLKGFDQLPGGFAGYAKAIATGKDVGFGAFAEGVTEAMQEGVNMAGIEFADPNAETSAAGVAITLLDALVAGGMGGAMCRRGHGWRDVRLGFRSRRIPGPVGSGEERPRHGGHVPRSATPLREKQGGYRQGSRPTGSFGAGQHPATPRNKPRGGSPRQPFALLGRRYRLFHRHRGAVQRTKRANP
jgi:hypothetical protein